MNDHDDRRSGRAEHAAWGSLLDAEPDPSLEERTVALLRRKGVLREPGPAPWIRYAGMAAAIGVIFAAGLATGMSLAAYQQHIPAEDSATPVQRAGSEYVDVSVEVTGPATIERLRDRILVRTHDSTVTVVIRSER